MNFYGVIGCVLLLIGIMARIVIVKAAASSAVDQNYWLLAAKAYREQSGLPIRIVGKYLMEDETQAYPPLFGILLGRIIGVHLQKKLTHIFEILEIISLAWLLFALSVSEDMLLLALGIYMTAPVMVVYNSQLTPRILGDLFLFNAMILQILAINNDTKIEIQWIYWALSAFLLAMVIMTHKMTLQLHLVLLPFWCWLLDAWQVGLATLTGIIIYILIVGIEFAKYQFKAHWDIVSFWYRNWAELGANQFKNSKIYGDDIKDKTTNFHQTGLLGLIKHIKTIISYLPVVCVLPVCSVTSGIYPPSWVILWLSVVYGLAILTLLVGPFKCLGGGHLYIFNAVIPASIYVSYLPCTFEVGFLLLFGISLTIYSLVMALKVVQNRQINRDNSFDQVIENISKIPATNFAVFPLQFAETVAQQTQHAVLWGGHGYGFKNLEGFYPVITKPLAVYFKKYNIRWVLWKETYWCNGEVQMINEGIIKKKEVIVFAEWKIAPVVIL